MPVTNIALAKPVFEYTFSICTLITNWDEYGLMKSSFEEKGFTNQCEYLIADNTKGNTYDAYEAINNFFALSKAKYTILVHQDVRCIDSFETLTTLIAELDIKDKGWAVCGNAGGVYPKKLFFYLEDGGMDKKTTEELPQQVFSLDENFLLVKNSAGLSVSYDLSGFHLYGTDICLIANFLGYHCYVIKFYVRHLSNGNYQNLDKDQVNFLKAYSKKFPNKIVRTSCLKFYMGNSAGKNKWYNYKFIFFWVKAFYKLRYKLTKELR